VRRRGRDGFPRQGRGDRRHPLPRTRLRDLTASASLLTERLKGLPLEQAKKISKDDVLGELGIEISPARIKCALLSLKVLKVALWTGRRGWGVIDGMREQETSFRDLQLDEVKKLIDDGYAVVDVREDWSGTRATCPGPSTWC